MHIRNLSLLAAWAAICLLLALGGCATAESQAYPYGGFVPPDYSLRPDERFPLILFLHGAGDTNPQEKMIPDYAARQANFPFIVITPRATRDWNAERLEILLTQVQQRWRVDPSRIYVTGLSM